MDREGIALADRLPPAEVGGHPLLERQLLPCDRHPRLVPGALDRCHADLRGDGLLPVPRPVAELPADRREIVLRLASLRQPHEALPRLRRRAAEERAHLGEHPAGDAEGVRVEVPPHQPQHAQLGSRRHPLRHQRLNIQGIIGRGDIGRRLIGTDVAPGKIGKLRDRRHERPPRRPGRHRRVFEGQPPRQQLLRARRQFDPATREGLMIGARLTGHVDRSGEDHE